MGRPHCAVAAGVGEIGPSWSALTVVMMPELVLVDRERMRSVCSGFERHVHGGCDRRSG